MSRATELLEQATPLPWAHHMDGASPRFCDGKHATDKGCTDIGEAEILYGIGRDQGISNTALIVYAVNRLPDYESAVEALERVVTFADSFASITDPTSEWSEQMNAVRAALARLRDEVPA